MSLIRMEAETRNPLHARCIQLLKSALKKTGSYSDHLQKLEKNMEICDWESMTKDEFLIHLFAERADMTMSSSRWRQDARNKIWKIMITKMVCMICWIISI